MVAILSSGDESRRDGGDVPTKGVVSTLANACMQAPCRGRRPTQRGDAASSRCQCVMGVSRGDLACMVAQDSSCLGHVSARHRVTPLLVLFFCLFRVC